MTSRSNSVPGVGEEDKLFIGSEVPNAARERPSTTQSRRDEANAVRKFALRLLIFFVPFILFAGRIEWLLWRTGETWPLERVIQYQQNNRHSIFARLAIDHGTFRYKYLQILRQRPRILVLGSSRVMAFRAEMFGRDAASFYNAGGMIHSIRDLNTFLERLPTEATPQVIILGIDFWWLNANIKSEANDDLAVGLKEDGVYNWRGHGNAVAAYVRGEGSLGKILYRGLPRDPNAIGLQALLNHQGFRFDGSKSFALSVPKTAEGWEKRLPTRGTVEKDILGGGPHFAFTDGISKPLLEQLRATLLRYRARGIYVIGYSPPVITAWDEVASRAPRQKEYWQQYHQSLPELFLSLDLPMFDLRTPGQLGLDDRYMRDAYHGHDTFDMHVLLHLCQTQPEIAAAFPDVQATARLALGSTRTNPLFLDLPGADEPPAPSLRKKRKR